ncbi:probable peptidyl-tRNA hydrolase [Sorex araneus]|uniref:probable peptidyl-tRNA hydrolase n=1 Tax=Sorex araneus TaxID=42254 RepID=UPI0024337E40|nr:probable peptidyl-tRNA hydrolase [Sorex araneus]
MSGRDMSPPRGIFQPMIWPSRPMHEYILAPRTSGKRWLVVGLGNPGVPDTRRSVGLALLERLAQRLGVAESWARDARCAADLARAALADAEVVLLRPRRRVNANGRCAARAAEMLGLAPDEVYLLHDELDKPLGKLALKLAGSPKGHEGVRSCISCLNSSLMPRLRVGIGSAQPPEDVQTYLMSPFSPAEQEQLSQVLDRAADLLLDHLQERGQAVPLDL